MPTKSLHLELTSDFSMPSFLAPLDKFIGRRGISSQMFSYIVTNFHGAANYLKEVHAFLKEEDVNIRTIRLNGKFSGTSTQLWVKILVVCGSLVLSP